MEGMKGRRVGRLKDKGVRGIREVDGGDEGKFKGVMVKMGRYSNWNSVARSCAKCRMELRGISQNERACNCVGNPSNEGVLKVGMVKGLTFHIKSRILKKIFISISNIYTEKVHSGSSKYK